MRRLWQEQKVPSLVGVSIQLWRYLIIRAILELFGWQLNKSIKIAINFFYS